MLVSAMEHLKNSVSTISKCQENCCEMVMYSLRNAYDDSILTISCTESLRKLRGSLNYCEITNAREARRNDIIFFDWYKGLYGQANAEHVGVIISVEGSIITYCDYNSSENPRHYATHQKSVNDNNIRAIMRRMTTDTPIEYKPKDITIHVGDRGVIVTLLQTIFNRFNSTKIEIDGYYGTETYNAVKEFQKSNNCEIDGIVGDETLTAITNKLK